MKNIKCILLVLLVLQTSLVVIILRQTHTVKISNSKYLSSTMVVMVEVIKALTCLAIVFYQSDFRFSSFIKRIQMSLNQPSETLKMLIPAALYAMQNNLLHVALTHLDAATFQVTYQMKILTTALFSVLLLKRTLSSRQWFALLLLTIGVALVQLPTTESSVSSLTTNSTLEKRLLGLLVVMLSAVSSGFAGVSFELLLKHGTLSIWIRNLQMAVFCFSFSVAAMLYNDIEKIKSQGIFQGYNSLVVIALLLQAFGGLLVACAVKYTNNIVKSFANSISIVLSSAISYYIFDDLHFRYSFLVGAIIVLAALFLFGTRRDVKAE